jgi:DNA-binding transcriptional LysR family regulator
MIFSPSIAVSHQYGTKVSQIDWNDFRVVVAIADAGAIRAAAKRLGVSHATVSRHLQEVEARLKVRLFDRMKEGYVPTPAGEDVIETAHKMDDEAAILSRRIAGRDHALEGIVRVTAPAFLAEALLAAPLAQFRSLYPRGRAAAYRRLRPPRSEPARGGRRGPHP